MPTVMISRKGKPVSKYPLVQRETRIGRRSGNEIVLGSWSVSGSHAVLVQDGSNVVVEDLGSRNGTFVDGHRVTRSPLGHASVVRIADFALTLMAPRMAMAYEPTLIVRTGSSGKPAQFQYLDGSAAGQTLTLSEVLTALGAPAVCEVTCIRRAGDYAVRFSQGPIQARLNGAVLGDVPVRLYDGDVLELGSDRLRFQVPRP